MTVFRDLWRNQPWQWLEEGCRKPALGVCFRRPVAPMHRAVSRLTLLAAMQ